MSRKDLYDHNYKYLYRRIIKLQLNENEMKDFRDKSVDGYLGTEWTNQKISRRLYFNNPVLLRSFDSIVTGHTQGERTPKTQMLVNDFMHDYFVNHERLNIPLDKDYDLKSLSDLQFYASIEKHTYIKLKDLWNDRTIVECIVDTARLIKNHAKDELMCFPLNMLYPNIGEDELFSGFKVIRNT